MLPFSEAMRRYKTARTLLGPFLEGLVEKEIIGEQNLVHSGPAIIVSNHRSDLDPFILTAAINRYIVWLVASYDFKIPVLGQFLQTLGMIPVSESKTDQIRAYKEVSRILKAKRLIGIFPEGDGYITNQDFSRRLGDFNPGFAHFALRCRAPVQPVTIVGIRENIEEWVVPKIIREFLGLPPHVVHTKNRLNLKQVKVVIQPLIAIEPYLELNSDEAVNLLVTDVRESMSQAVVEHGEVERRKNKSRQSGTRVLPDEKA